MPPRYRRLINEVVRRLPDDWDQGVVWRATASEDDAPGFAAVGGKASTPERTVTLFVPNMDLLSDAACRFIIAHELGHVAPVLPPHAEVAGRQCLLVDGRWRPSKLPPERLEQLYEGAADRLAFDWGFGVEAMPSGERSKLSKTGSGRVELARPWAAQEKHANDAGRRAENQRIRPRPPGMSTPIPCRPAAGRP